MDEMKCKNFNQKIINSLMKTVTGFWIEKNNTKKIKHQFEKIADLMKVKEIT